MKKCRSAVICKFSNKSQVYSLITFFTLASAFSHVPTAFASTGVYDTTVTDTVKYDFADSSIGENEANDMYNSSDSYFTSELYLDGYYSDYDGEIFFNGAYSYDEYHEFFYTTSGEQLFTTSPEHYGYIISIQQTGDIELSKNYIFSFSQLVGSSADINGAAALIGSRDSHSNVFFLESNNAVYDVYLSYLLRCRTYENANGGFYNASFSISSEYDITIRSLKTKDAYNAVLNEVNNNLDEGNQLQEETNTKLDNLTSGYDNSSLTDSNAALSGSLSEYDSVESDLFDSASSSLGGFSLTPINMIPQMVTSISFVTSCIQMIYDYAFMGVSGFGAVLPVIFTVTFIAAVIGIYRYATRKD